MRFRLLLLALLSFQFSFGQDSLPQHYFKSPLRVPLNLSGNFGELRSNHFHSGLDLRTDGHTGLDVLASADGYISRIKVRTYGYGKSLYIQHPNGYTTVCGHLKGFSPKIRAYVRKQMYAKEKNTIQLFPEKTDLPVKQGEVIAKSGESGGAGGPHLHFEIRNARQQPMNPLKFGIKIKDSRSPLVKALYIYPQGKDSQVNGSARRMRIRLIKEDDGSFRAESFSAYGKLGFGITAIDHTDDSPYTDGIYEIKTTLNGQPRFDIRFNRFSFSNTRYINRYIDYRYYKKHRKRIQKLFLQPNEKIDMYLTTDKKGFVTVKDSLSYVYKINLSDYSGNKTIVRVPIEVRKLPLDKITPKKVDTTAYLAFADKANVFTLKYHDVYVPSGALYQNTYLDIEDHPDKIKVHNRFTPLQENITVGFDASQYSPEDRAKLYVVRVYPWGSKYYSKTYKDGTRITTRTRTFGTFELATDRTPPEITPVNFRDGKWMSKAKYLKVKIKDDESGIASYRGTINGKFIMTYYDYKTDTITYEFRDHVSSKVKKHLKFIVVDNVGNSSTFEATIYRKE